MRILLLNQYYHPDLAATAQLATDLGGALASRGHEVSVVASNRLYAQNGARLPLRDHHQGVAITRVPSTAFGRRSILFRAADYGSFFAGAAALLAPRRPDVVLALTTPPMIGALGLGLQALRRTRLVLWVMDVYPDLAVALGAIPAGGVVARSLAGATRLMLDRGDAVVSLDEAMRDRLVAAGAAPEKVEVIDNWCDGDAIRPAPAEGNALRRQLGLEGVFVVSYSGNMGLSHDFATVAEAMALLRDEPIHFLFIGDGPRRPWLEAEVRARGLGRVSFLAYRPREELPVSLTAADASLVMLEEPLAGLMVPSKLYGLLAAGVPVLYVGPAAGRVDSVVANEGAGLAVRNGDAAGLAAAIRRLRDEPGLRRAMGARGRAVFEARFHRELAIERHHQLLLRVAGAR
jgi:glycosyltransferase involved in cell wall biosynthesis